MRLVRGVVAVLKPHYLALLIRELGPILENRPKGGVDGEIPGIFTTETLVIPNNEYDETADWLRSTYSIQFY